LNKERQSDSGKKVKSKGGRPPKKTCQVRSYKHTLFLSDPEEKLLRQMVENTGKSAAELFRHGLFNKGLRIPKARIAPAELMELLIDFKKKSGLIQLLAHKEKDFSEAEKEVLIGSSTSMRKAIERLERSVFLSLEKADELEQLRQLLYMIEAVKEDIKLKKHQAGIQEVKQIEKIVDKAKMLLKLYYQYLTLA
jgi:hypothetical protein